MPMRRGIPHEYFPHLEPGHKDIPPGSEFMGIPVVFDPDVEVAFAVGIWPLKRIKVGARFLTFDRDMQVAILLHELGHCRMFHMEQRMLMIPLFWTKWAFRVAHNQEIAADAFAARGGYGVHMLRFLAFARDGAEYHPSKERRMIALAKLTEASNYAYATP